MPGVVTPDQERDESTVTPSTSHKRYTQVQPGVQCTFAYQYLDRSSCLVDVEFGEIFKGGLVFNNAGPCISRTLSERWHCKVLTTLFTRTILGTSEVQQVLLAKFPSTSSLSRVYLQDFTRDPLLTEAYHDPNVVLSDWNPSSRDYLFPMALAKQHQDLKGQRIIVIRRIIDKNKVTILQALLLFASPTLGLVVGLSSHRADLGIAVSAGVWALASCTQGLAAWVQK